MARFVRGKKFETSDGFPGIPVQTVLKLRLDLEEEKSLKKRMDFQESQCKNVLKLWLDLKEKKKWETTDGFPTIPLPKRVATMARFVRGKKFETTNGFPTNLVHISVNYG